MQFLTACIASLELLQITCGCSTDGPECESSRENEGQDAELGQAARSHLGSRVFLRVSDPANLANRTGSVCVILLTFYFNLEVRNKLMLKYSRIYF